MAGSIFSRILAFSLLLVLTALLGLLVFSAALGHNEVRGEEPLPAGTVIYGSVEWKEDHELSTNLTIAKDSYLKVVESNIIFNNSQEGQFGLTIRPGGVLVLVNGALTGVHPISLNVQGELRGYEARLGAVIDDNSSHFSSTGRLWWDGGEFDTPLLRFHDSKLVLANYSQAEAVPEFWLYNTSLRLFDSQFNLSRVNWTGGPIDLEKGHFLDLTFYTYTSWDLSKMVPITDGNLSVHRNDSLQWLTRTNETGGVGSRGLTTHRWVDDSWFDLGDFQMSFNRSSNWWLDWNLTLNETLVEQVILYGFISFDDVKVIVRGKNEMLMEGDNLTLQVKVKNDGNVWIKGRVIVSLLARATTVVWADELEMVLPPSSSSIITFNWKAEKHGNYAMYLVFTHQTTSQVPIDVEKPSEDPPTFLGLGYEYWLVILPLLAILSAVSVAVIREERRLGKYRVEEVFLLDSIGRVIGHSAEGEGSLDSDIVGSMLSALQDFVAESFQAGGSAPEADGTDGEEAPQRLKRLEHGALMLLIEHGYHCFIVLVISGQDRPEIRRFMVDSLKDIEARFGPVLSNWDGDAAKLEGAGEIVGQLARVKSSVRWKFDPRALIAGWKERHVGKRP